MFKLNSPLFLNLSFYFYSIILFLNFPDKILDRVHDYPSQHLLQYYLLNGYQWGVDFIQNSGPLSFINYSMLFTGKFFFISLLLNIVLIIIFIYVLLKYCSYNFSTFCFLLGLSIFAYGDVKFYIFSLLLIFLSKSLLDLCLLGFFLGILTLAKSTFLIFSLGYLILYCGFLFLYQKKIENVLPILVYFFTLTLGWILAGQSLSNLSNYFISINYFISGYAESLVLYGKPKELIIGFLLTLVLIYSIYKIKINESNYILTFIKKAFAFFIVFISFKHAFVRADIHVLIFSYFSICILMIFFYFEYKFKK